jgi:hypothetical protein
MNLPKPLKRLNYVKMIIQSIEFRCLLCMSIPQSFHSIAETFFGPIRVDQSTYQIRTTHISKRFLKRHGRLLHEICCFTVYASVLGWRINSEDILILPTNNTLTIDWDAFRLKLSKYRLQDHHCYQVAMICLNRPSCREHLSRCLAI